MTRAKPLTPALSPEYGGEGEQFTARRAALTSAAILLTVSAVAVGFAIHLRDGEYTPAAVGWIGVALAACLASFFVPRRLTFRYGETFLLAVLSVSLAFQFRQLLRSPPSGWNWWSDD